MILGAALQRNLYSLGRAQAVFRTTQHLAVRNHYIATTSHDNFTLKPNSSKSIGTKHVQIRTIFTDELLGIPKLERLRENKSRLYGESSESYINRLRGYLDTNDAKSIFFEDLLNMVGLAQTEEHFDLIDRLAARLKSDSNSDITYAGVTIMRLYLSQNQVERAYKNIKDAETYGNLFSLLTSYQIVMTALYRTGRYQDVIELYELARDRLDLKAHGPLSRRLSLPVYSSCAKLATPESLAIAERIYHEEGDHQSMKKRVLTILSYLNLRLGNYTEALNWLTQAGSARYVTSREIKTLSLLKLGRYEDLFFHLRDSLSELKDNLSLLTREGYESIEHALNKIKDEQLRQKLEEILVESKANKLVNMETTIEDLIFNPVKLNKNQSDTRQQNRPQRQSRSQRMPQAGDFQNRPRRAISGQREDLGY